MEAKKTESYTVINSLFPLDIANISQKCSGIPFIIKEHLPIDLTSGENYYITKELVYTNQVVEPIGNVYKIDDKYIYLIGVN